MLQGMQTDPKLDPLTQWSKGVDKSMSWRPPMPPQDWMDYDPTGGFTQETSHKANVRIFMLKGLEPPVVEEQSNNAITFIKVEVIIIINYHLLTGSV